MRRRSANLIEVHGPLMVFGFLGTVISLERAVALRRARGYLAPGGTLLGAGLLLGCVRQGIGELLLAGCVRRRRALARRAPARPGRLNATAITPFLVATIASAVLQHVRTHRRTTTSPRAPRHAAEVGR